MSVATFRRKSRIGNSGHTLSPVKVTKVNGALRATFSVIYIYSGAKPHTSGISNMIVGLKPQGRSYVIAAIAKTDVR